MTIAEQAPLKIGEVAQIFDLPISTLRYYDQQGFFPAMERQGGQRLFSQLEISTLEVIECLKKSGLSLTDIGAFIESCQRGDETLNERLQLFLDRKKALDKQLKELRKVEALLEFKVWYYETAIAAGTEQAVRDIPEDEMPEQIRKAYRASHTR